MIRRCACSTASSWSKKRSSPAHGAVFERVLDNRPKEPDVLFAVGILSLELDDLDAARGYLTRLHQTGERT